MSIKMQTLPLNNNQLLLTRFISRLGNNQSIELVIKKRDGKSLVKFIVKRLPDIVVYDFPSGEPRG